MRILVAISALMMTGACSIQEHIVPVTFSRTATREVCIREHAATRETFLAEYQRVLEQRGFQVRVVPENSPLTTCPIMTTYIARWSWDLTIYMSYAELHVYDNGVDVGRAVYDSRSGGARMDKFIDAETKIRQLVDQLFIVQQ